MNNKYDITWNDVPQDVKDLVEVGIYTKEEALEKMGMSIDIKEYEELYGSMAREREYKEQLEWQRSGGVVSYAVKKKNIKQIDVYLITNCVDDAYVFTSKIKADKKIKEFPNYTVYEWIDLKRYHYEDTIVHPTRVAWKRPCKRVESGTEFDDTNTPWEMLLLAKDKNQWTTNRKNFDSIKYAMEQFGNKKYYKILGKDIPMEKDTVRKSIWIDGGTNFCGLFDAEITDRKWLENFKNELHPSDDWTNVDLETYGKWIRKFDDKEGSKIVDAALKAGVVGYLD